MTTDIFEHLKKQASDLKDREVSLEEAEKKLQAQAKRIEYLEQFEVLTSLRDYRDWRGNWRQWR